MYQLSIVSSSNYIMTEKSQDEKETLPPFEVYEFGSDLVSVTRDSTKIGERNVKYTVELKTPTPLKFRSYILL
jgi:hypothetical protein